MTESRGLKPCWKLFTQTKLRMKLKIEIAMSGEAFGTFLDTKLANAISAARPS